MTLLERYAETLGRIEGVCEMNAAYLLADDKALIRIRQIIADFEAAKKEAQS